MSGSARTRWTAATLGVLVSMAALGGTTVGRTAGEASVTASGAARYAIPLLLPPGTNGLAPDLALVYDSRRGQGLLGAGFHLSGFSSIDRCAATLVPDGRVGTVSLGVTDRFCLDGLRLQLVSGAYGAPGSQYRTEVESFARVTAIGSAGGGPASFRVERADGRIFEYGSREDSRVESMGSTTPRRWALSRISDRDGNFVDYRYQEDVATGSHRPVRIEYTGNTTAGTLPFYSVRFAYEARPAEDVPRAYLAGGLVSDPLRLGHIDVLHDGTGRVVRSFALTYGAPGPTGRSRLASVQECAGSTCLPPTTFEWTAVAAGWSVNMSVALPAETYARAIPGDIDGDGFDDLAYFDGSLSSWSVLRGSPYGFVSLGTNLGLGGDSDSSQALSADLDGNGTRDVLVPGSGNYWHWLRRTATGGYAYTATGVINPAPPGGLIAVDIDGDARDDLVYVKSTGTAIYWRRNQTVTSSSYAAEAVLWTVPAGVRLSAAPFVESQQRFRSIVRSGDFNGDRRSDLLVLTQQSGCGATSTCATWTNRWQVLASTGSSLVPQHSFDGNGEALLADFNGDGLSDIAYGVPGGTWQLLFGTGTRGSALAGMTGPASSSATVPASGRTLVIDWDADGRTDLLQPQSDGELRYCASTGTTLAACQSAGSAASATLTAPMALDVNGDAYPDFTYAGSTGVRLLLHHQVPPDLLVAATDGMGARSDFQYLPLTNAAVHVAGTGAAFPVREHFRPGQVVSRVTRAGAQGFRQESFVYEGARVHMHGRGFLGFARRTATPTSGDLEIVEEYSQDPAAFERIGRVIRVTQQQRSGKPVARTTYTWSSRSYGTGSEARRFPYAATVQDERFELDGTRVSSARTSSSYDSFGSLLQRDTVWTEHAKGMHPGAEHRETTSLQGVTNDETNWCLGRPATVQVTRRHSLDNGAPISRTQSFTWDYARCRVAETIVEPGDPALQVGTSFAHDAFGNLSSATVTPVGLPGRVTLWSWSVDGRFVSTITNAEGHRSTLSWDAVTALSTRSVDANGLAMQRQYDDLGRLVREIRPDGTSTVVEWSSCGAGCPWSGTRLVTAVSLRDVADGVLASTETGEDAFGREVYRRDDQPGGTRRWQVRRYDSRGRLSQQSVAAPCCAIPTRWQTYAYDALDRPVLLELPASEGRPAATTTRWQYDGLSLSTIDPLGRLTTHQSDVLGNVLTVTDPQLASISYAYDAFDNLVRVRDAKGGETTLSYDQRGYRRTLRNPSLGAWSFDYWPTGELRAQTNARGQKTTFTHDRLSRPLTRKEPEGTTTWTWGTSASSRNIGALARVTSPGFRETYKYDTRGRPSSVTTTVAGLAFTTKSSYDASTGALSVLTYPASTGAAPLQVRHHYDRGRLVRLSDAVSGSTFWQLDDLDGQGRTSGESLGNGIVVSSSYDSVTGRLLARAAGPAASLQNISLVWDAAGNLVRRDEPLRGLVEQFTYDNLDRLDLVIRDGAVALDLAYDLAGDSTYKSDVGTYVYDPSRPHTVVAAGDNTYAYDANGAVVRANGTTVSWFSYDLPSRITHPAGNESTFQYGPDRRRFRQVARTGSDSVETIYAAGGLYERVTKGTETIHRHYLVADGRRVAVHTRDSTKPPETVYLLEDHLGSIDAITSSTGKLLARLSYQPFGARRSSAGAGGSPSPTEWAQLQSAGPRGFTGHEHLDNLGLIHMDGRVYDPVLGRFLSPDPVVQAPYDSRALNRYSYVWNNPLKYTDPTGHCLNTLPGKDYRPPQCLEHIFVEAWRSLGAHWSIVDTQRAISDRGIFSVDTPSDENSGAYGTGPGHPEIEEVVTTAGRIASPSDFQRPTYLADLLIRYLVFDYEEPLADSYWLEAATLLPALKTAKWNRIRRLAGLPTKRVFWSGGRAAEDAAKAFADANGGVVIGDTFLGRTLSRTSGNVPWVQARPVWVDLSREFARGAQGTVDVFQNARGLSLDSIWRIEYQQLRANPAVTSINFHVVMPDGSVVPLR